jgi:hypothetical protein
MIKTDMKMTKYGFSLSRLCLVAKRDILENWKKNLYNCLTLYAILASALVFTMLRLHGVHEKVPNGFWVCMALVAFGGWAVVLSNVMESMSTKAKRIAFLMVPATSLEKYLWRLIYVTVGFAVSFAVALLATDVTYLLLNSIFGEEEYRSLAGFAIGVYLNWNSLALDDSWLLTSWAYVFTAWGYSFFVLGGTFWRKRAFVKTAGCILLAFLLLLTVMQWVPVAAEHSFYDWVNSIMSDEGKATVAVSLLTAVFFIFTVFNLWLGYRLFRRSQIVGFKRSKL